MSVAQPTRKPFHQIVVDEIRQPDSSTNFLCLYRLLLGTTIPDGHAEILAAIQECWGPLGYWSREVRELTESLTSQMDSANPNDGQGTLPLEAASAAEESDDYENVSEQSA